MSDDADDESFRASETSERDAESPSGANRGLADGIAIANQILVLSAGLVVPILGGFWADAYFESLPWLTVLGLAVGMAIAGVLMRQMLGWLQLRNQRRATHKSSAAASAKPLRKSENQDQAEDPWDQRWREKWEDDSAPPTQ